MEKEAIDLSGGHHYLSFDNGLKLHWTYGIIEDVFI